MEAATQTGSAGSADIIPRDQIRRTESRFDRLGGPSLFRASWSCPEPQFLIVVVHGFGEHCLRYDEFAVWFAQRGAIVHSFDLRGHGRSPGPRGHVDDFSDHHKDLAELLERVREEHPELPCVLIGHSMGGLIVTSFVRETNPRDLACLVTSGAALSLSPDVSKLKVLLAKALARILPRLSMDAGLDSNGISRDPEVVRLYDEDPLVHGRMTAAGAAAMMSAIARTAAGGSGFSLPTLMLHGAEDPLCLKSGTEAFFATLPGARGGEPRAELRIYPGMKHEIFNEIGRESVYEDIYQWIEGLVSEATGNA